MPEACRIRTENGDRLRCPHISAFFGKASGSCLPFLSRGHQRLLALDSSHRPCGTKRRLVWCQVAPQGLALGTGMAKSCHATRRAST